VDKNNILKGVLSDGDVRREVCCGPFDLTRPIVDVMTISPIRATGGESSAHVLDVMEQNEITVLPVVRDDGALVGMVHLHDLLGKGSLRFSDSHSGDAE
jgi:arabinose-5-phosphate isomerase